MSTLLK
jgi:hypothetical protein